MSDVFLLLLLLFVCLFLFFFPNGKDSFHVVLSPIFFLNRRVVTKCFLFIHILTNITQPSCVCVSVCSSVLENKRLISEWTDMMGVFHMDNNCLLSPVGIGKRSTIRI